MPCLEASPSMHVHPGGTNTRHATTSPIPPCTPTPIFSCPRRASIPPFRMGTTTSSANGRLASSARPASRCKRVVNRRQITIHGVGLPPFKFVASAAAACLGTSTTVAIHPFHGPSVHQLARADETIASSRRLSRAAARLQYALDCSPPAARDWTDRLHEVTRRQAAAGAAGRDCATPSGSAINLLVQLRR